MDAGGLFPLTAPLPAHRPCLIIGPMARLRHVKETLQTPPSRDGDGGGFGFWSRDREAPGAWQAFYYSRSVTRPWPCRVRREPGCSAGPTAAAHRARGLGGRGPRAPGAGEGARDSPPELCRRARPGRSLSMDFLGCLGDTNRSKTVRTQSRLGPRTQAAATTAKEIKATCGRISGW